MTTNEETATDNQEFTVDAVTKIDAAEKDGTQNEAHCMSSEDLEATGLLQEINRLHLNPIGLSLQAVGPLEPIYFVIRDFECATVGAPNMENVRKFQAIQAERNGVRKKKLGYVTQPLK